MAFRWIRTALLSFLVVLCFSTLIWNANAQDLTPQNTITVQGSGLVTAKPDSVQLYLGVQTQGETIEAARQENSQKSAAVIRSIRALGVPNLEIQTTSFNVYPFYATETSLTPLSSGENKIVGYRVNNQLRVQVEDVNSTKLSGYSSQIIDTALKAGTNTSGGPNFYLSQRSHAQQEALKFAIQQAHQIAETVAHETGVRLTGIYNMEVYSQPTIMSRSFAMAKPETTSTPIESGEIEVTSHITIRYSFKPITASK